MIQDYNHTFLLTKGGNTFMCLMQLNMQQKEHIK